MSIVAIPPPQPRERASLASDPASGRAGTASSRVRSTLIYALAAAAADGDLDFLLGAVELAAGLDDHGDVAGLRHLDAVGDGRQRARRNLVRRHQRNRVLAH